MKATEQINILKSAGYFKSGEDAYSLISHINSMAEDMKHLKDEVSDLIVLHRKSTERNLDVIFQRDILLELIESIFLIPSFNYKAKKVIRLCADIKDSDERMKRFEKEMITLMMEGCK